MSMDYEKAREGQPTAPVSEAVIEVVVVSKRCVYVNSYRIAGSKPYVSEGLPQHSLKTTIGDCLDAFSDAQIAAYLAERKARKDYWAAWAKSRKASPISGEGGL